MDTKTALAAFTILTSLVIGTLSITGSAWAAKSSASNGIDTADTNVHDNTGLGSSQDVRFHEGLCQAGISTAVLDSIGGCSNPIITPPGNSENKP